MAASALLLTGLGCLGVAAAGQTGPPQALPPSSENAPRAHAATADAAGSSRAADVVREREPAARETGERKDRSAPRRAEPRTAAADEAVKTPPPVRLTVPSVQIQTALVPLRLTRSGQVEAPEQYDRAGWFQQGVLPGDSGAAVIAGHVDSTRGPAVFYRLSALEPGAKIVVDRQDGSSATFRVDRLATYPKDAFPTVEVYATNRRELRLITCGGAFNDTERHYEHNIVVYASLVEPT